MKKSVLFVVLAGLASLYSCTKEGKTTTVTIRDTTVITVPPGRHVNPDPDSVTAILKVGYGALVANATFPGVAADTNYPKLDTLSNKTYKVVPGRYMTIYPMNGGGEVAGYYVQVIGARSYFKVDYTKEYGIRKNARGRGTGYIDSAIVFKIPASLNGDTFQIRYAAYDSQDRVGLPVAATVVVLPEGNSAQADSLKGRWKYYAYKDVKNNVISDWIVDTSKNSYNTYKCNNNKLEDSDTLTYTLKVVTIIEYHAIVYSLNNYIMTRNDTSSQRYMDYAKSTCTDYVYYLVGWGADRDAGGYSFDPQTRKLTFIYDNGSNVELRYETYDVLAINANTLILSVDTGAGTDDFHMYYKQFIRL